MIVEADGVTVINVRRHRIRWQDITAVEWRNRLGERGLSFELPDGRRRSAWAVGTGQVGSDWAYRTYEDMLACWQATRSHADHVRSRA